jgi:hypothetical protein
LNILENNKITKDTVNFLDEINFKNHSFNNENINNHSSSSSSMIDYILGSDKRDLDEKNHKT